MAARYFAEAAGCPISFVWPSIDDPLYTSQNLLKFEAASEVFRDTLVFKDLGHSVLSERGATDGLMVFAIHSVLHNDGMLSLEEVLRAAEGYDIILYDMPFVIADYESIAASSLLFKTYWRKFYFTEDVLAESVRIRSRFADQRFAAIHMRRGDTKKMLAESPLEFLLHVGFRQLFQRYLPIEQAAFMVRCYLDEPLPIVVVSEDVTVARRVALLLPESKISQSSGLFPQDSNKQALLDLMLIADAEILFSPSTSFFSECAAKVGNGINVRASIEINLLVEEIFSHLDGSPESEVGMRKAALLDTAYAVMQEADDVDFANMRISADMYRPKTDMSGEADLR